MSKPKKKIIFLSALLYLVALVFFIWGVAAVKHNIFPWQHLSPIYNEVTAYFNFTDSAQKSTKDKIILAPQEYRNRYRYAGFKLRDKTFHDSGYLLISRFSKKHGQTIIELFSIAKRENLHTWVPPLAEIFQQTSDFAEAPNTKREYQAQHPLLLKDGGLVFTSGEGPMVRINACGEIVWIINRHFHHSIELDHLGRIVSPIVIKKKNPNVILPMRDDGFAIISITGNILKEYSIADILLKNGYRGLIYGVGNFESDRIHLNDAQPITKGFSGASIGDVALSSRHLSSVFLFQPKSGKIKWLKTGPWLNQHDINPLGDGSYSIFGNDNVRQHEDRSVFVEPNLSNVYIYNPLKNEVTRPYRKVMARQQVSTWTAGRSKILANGDVYIEESDRSRLLRISGNKVRWEYVNAISRTTVGGVHWSRYTAESEIDLTWMRGMMCK